MRVFTEYRIQNVATPHKIFQPPAQRVCQGQTRPDDHGEEDRFYCATAMWFLCSCLKFVGNRDCVASLLGLDYAIATWLSRPHTVASQAQNQTWEAGICGYELWGSSELSYGYHCHSINGIHIPCFAWPRSYRLSIHMICWKTPAKHGWLPERKEHNVHSMHER